MVIFVSKNNNIYVAGSGDEKKTLRTNNDNLPESYTVTDIQHFYHGGILGSGFLITLKNHGLYYGISGLEGDVSKTHSDITEFKLQANYPNPFNPSTEIRFNLPRASEVRLTVHDLLGRKVATLVDERLPAGSQTVTFDAGNLSSGVYLYRLQADGYSETRKMLLVK